MLCKWGFFREQLDYLYTPPHEHQTVIKPIAQKLAINMSSTELEYLWDLNMVIFNPSRLFIGNRNPLAIILLSWADAQYREDKQIVGIEGSFQGSAISLIGELPIQPDRKVCMTCGDRVDGVIYCSEECRPSAFLEWYTHHSTRAETPTITEGFRTARTRFKSSSADSSSTHDTTKFVPPPYSLVDANPPPPKFVPVKEEPQEDAEIIELSWYSGLEKELGRPLVRSPSHSRLASLRSYRRLDFHHNIMMKAYQSSG